MPMPANIDEVLQATVEKLLAARSNEGCWRGRLSSSALSTATSAFSLHLLDEARSTDGHRKVIVRAIKWLIEHQNSDGGWGDTISSPSNVSTTLLCLAAVGGVAYETEDGESSLGRAHDWVRSRIGELTPKSTADAVKQVYGKDKTFAIPILTMCTLAGVFPNRRQTWREIPALPYELAALPQRWFRLMKLPVVSYALPALIAIGQVRDHYHRARCPVRRVARRLTRRRTLGILRSIQPSSGGFLEAAPLTGFVLMSMATIGQSDGPVAREAARFLLESVREDGSWPIDTDLATWLTTLAVNGLRFGRGTASWPAKSERLKTLNWLLEQQYGQRHPYTGASPGGWAWTDRPGGVPDADDTAGALLALNKLVAGAPGDLAARTASAGRAGVVWLLDVQNKDGGIPTFCRGWGRFPFDRSSPDITAHALRAWQAWRNKVDGRLSRHIDKAIVSARRYLVKSQQTDGRWIPLWFGNQLSEHQTNPLYGTSRVILAGASNREELIRNTKWGHAIDKGLVWLERCQNEDGGWGGDVGLASSIEETAMAVEALAAASANESTVKPEAIQRGCKWLSERTRGGVEFCSSPIGLYFASLWYDEQLYPLLFCASALGKYLKSMNR